MDNNPMVMAAAEKGFSCDKPLKLFNSSPAVCPTWFMIEKTINEDIP